eukprot:4773764-Amphidinium_carterae.1
MVHHISRVGNCSNAEINVDTHSFRRHEMEVCPLEAPSGGGLKGSVSGLDCEPLNQVAKSIVPARIAADLSVVAVGIKQGTPSLRDDRAKCRWLVLPIEALFVRAFRWKHELPAHSKLERSIAEDKRWLGG